MDSSAPLTFQLKADATPSAIHKAANISIHWMDEIKAELDKDVRLGVIEPVPPNTPSVWCSRMGIIAKKSGKPRRVVDLRQLNRWTVRQTHHTDPPFVQAGKVPPHTWRTCMDA